MIWSEEHEGQTSGSEGARPRSGTRDGGCFGVRRHMTPKRTQICYRTCHPTDAQVDGLLVTSSSLSFIGASGDRVSSSGNFSTWQRDDGRIRDDSPPAGRDRCARIRATVHSATPMIELGRSDCVGHVANLRQARTCRGMHHESFSRIDFVAVSRTPLLVAESCRCPTRFGHAADTERTAKGRYGVSSYRAVDRKTGNSAERGSRLPWLGSVNHVQSPTCPR